MNDKELRETIEALPDGAFIDLLDVLLCYEFGLTATEWIEHKYKQGGRGTKELIEDLRDYQNEI